jgi:hypothetical protein
MRSRKVSPARPRVVRNTTPRSYVWRVKHYLGSSGHVVGMVFAIAGIVLFTSGLITGWLAVAVVAALYVTGYFFAARPRQEQLAPQQATDAREVRDALDEMLAAIKKRVSNDIYYRVRSIRDATVFTLENAGGITATDPDIHVVRRAATSYLPEALATYLSLPRHYAENERIANGRTPHDVLIDQLTLIDNQARRVAEELIQRSSDQLVTHGKFMSDRYARSTLQPEESVVRAPAVTKAEQVEQVEQVERQHVH